MYVSFNDIYNENTNHTDIIGLFNNNNNSNMLENEHDEIYITTTNPTYLYSASYNYLYVLDEMIRQAKEYHNSISIFDIHVDELQYLLGSMVSLYGIYYCIEKLINSIYEK